MISIIREEIRNLFQGIDIVDFKERISLQDTLRKRYHAIFAELQGTIRWSSKELRFLIDYMQSEIGIFMGVCPFCRLDEYGKQSCGISGYDCYCRVPQEYCCLRNGSDYFGLDTPLLMSRPAEEK